MVNRPNISLVHNPPRGMVHKYFEMSAGCDEKPLLNFISLA